MTDFVVRRVLIACDAVCENDAVIETAARLAARWDVALHGVFVEDEGLLQIAALPFAKQVSLSGGASEEMDEASVEHHFVALAERTRASLETAARERGVDWSFSIVRDKPSIAALSALENDLLIVAGESRPFAGQYRLGSHWSTAAFESTWPVLLVRSDGPRNGDVVALVQTSGSSARRSVSAAARFAAAADRVLTVLVAAPDVSAAVARDWVRAISAPAAARCRVETVSAGPNLLLQAIARRDGDTLVIDADPAAADPALLKTLVARTKADVLFVR
jgi:hypothetical protein